MTFPALQETIELNTAFPCGNVDPADGWRPCPAVWFFWRLRGEPGRSAVEVDAEVAARPVDARRIARDRVLCQAHEYARDLQLPSNPRFTERSFDVIDPSKSGLPSAGESRPFVGTWLTANDRSYGSTCEVRVNSLFSFTFAFVKHKG